MMIFPAIDMKDGKCVRLVQGDYATVHTVAQDAAKTAEGFEIPGAEWIHMVDLDGAKDAKPANSSLVFAVLAQTDLKVEIGGGIRNMETIDFYLQQGISRIILGSAALQNPELISRAAAKYGEKIAVGIDALNGKVATQGWLEHSQVDYITLAKQMEQHGVRTIIFTDISKDGTLSGPNLEQLDALNQAVSCNVIASGGVSNLDDILALRELNLYGAICGKALYTGDLDLSKAISAARGEPV